MKKYYIVLAVLLPLLVLVLIKSLSRDHFRNDASRWTAPSISKTNVITTENLKALEGNTLIVIIGNWDEAFKAKGEIVIIPAESLLEKENQKKLRVHSGNIVLVSDDPALSARMWMLLSQMGYKKLYILSDSVEDEALKHKFQPDTATGPEL
jgi:hypothetical protein